MTGMAYHANKKNIGMIADSILKSGNPDMYFVSSRQNQESYNPTAGKVPDIKPKYGLDAVKMAPARSDIHEYSHLENRPYDGKHSFFNFYGI